MASLDPRHLALKASLLDKIRGNPIMAEVFAQALAEGSAEHRIVRNMTVERVGEAIAASRIARGAPGYEAVPGSKVHMGVFMDYETTGLDAEKDRVIQMAAISFSFDRAGLLSFDEKIFAGFQDPGMPIPPEVQELTGITDEMVAGKSLDFDAVRPMVLDARVFVAHNAAFDRPFAERLEDPAIREAMQSRGWLCSSSQVDWTGRGMSSAKLGLIALECGWFFGAHLADNDCLAGIAVMSEPGEPEPQKTDSQIAETGQATENSNEAPSIVLSDAFNEMLRAGSLATHRVWAKDAPFEAKDRLRTRGYVWDGDARAGFKSWWKDIATLDDLIEEKLWLATEVYPKRGGEVGLADIGPRDRFSIRAWAPARTEFLVRQDLKIALAARKSEAEQPSLALSG